MVFSALPLFFLNMFGWNVCFILLSFTSHPGKIYHEASISDKCKTSKCMLFPMPKILFPKNLIIFLCSYLSKASQSLKSPKMGILEFIHLQSLYSFLFVLPVSHGIMAIETAFLFWQLCLLFHQHCTWEVYLSPEIFQIHPSASHFIQ